MNLQTRVADLHTWVLSVSAVSHDKYQLVSGYPPMALVDPQATVEQARLANSNIIQRML